ncbi:MAG: pyruvate dehydrogenase (acetyl-transferring) E1 component subunit alpha [Halorubrum sp.]
MPRETIASFDITYQEVLSPDGSVDEALLPTELSDAELRELYRQMKLARRLDERAVALQRRGELGTYAPSTGQEAAQVGSAAALREDDWFVPAFREQAAALALGGDARDVLLYAMGYEEGAEIPDGMNALPPAIPVGSQPLHAAGIGWGESLKGSDRVAITYFGDGATSQGDVYEAMNFAGVYDAQTVFCCQNNQYAISTPRRVQTQAETLAQKAIAAGIESIQVDGNDALGMYAATRDAIERAREGNPVLIEALTYRHRMHTTSDDPSRYRSSAEEDEWLAKDPLVRYEAFLRDRSILDDETAEAIDDEIEVTLEDAITVARDVAAEADAADMFRHVFAEMPPSLRRQHAQFTGGEGDDE